ncbi:MAG TPA: DUF4244 domain-containing protein [Kutzneria sp.]|jgi:hypothetical protein
MRGLLRRIRVLLASDDGSVSVEFVLLTLTVAALAGTLYLIVGGDAVRAAIEHLIDRALSVPV